MTEVGGGGFPHGLYRDGFPTMQLNLLKSKLHRAEVTDLSLNCEGSLALDLTLMDLVDLREFEHILIDIMADGQRFETYTIPALSGSGTISLNGATAKLGSRSDLRTITSFAVGDEREIATWIPRIAIPPETKPEFVKSTPASA